MTSTKGLPGGWLSATLGAIRLDRSTSIDPSKLKTETFELYSIPAYPSGRPEVVTGNEVGSTKKSLAPGTVVVSKINPRINRVWVVGERSAHRQIGSSEWIPFFPLEGLDPKYLAYFMQQDAFRNYLAANVSGVGGSLMRVKPSTLDPYPLVLAPGPEQSRIVEAIESYFTRLDDAVATLERVQRNLQRYRASVLKAAVEGRLVPTEAELARAEGREYQPASVLLERILAERRLRWEEAELARMKTKAKVPKDDNWKAKYKEPVAPDSDTLPNLPEGWCWTRVDVAGHVQLGRQRSPAYHTGADMRPYLRVANVFEDRIDTTDVMSMNFTAKDFAAYHLKYGDILLNEGQSPHLVGRPAMYKDEVPGACFTNSLIRFQASAGVDPRFALVVFLAQLHMRRYMRIAQITTNIAHLGAGRFAEVEFPLPPLLEQSRIADEVERLMTTTSVARAMVASNLARVARLFQSILRWAFEGRLVDQDPTDEPASRLLERILAERASADGLPRQSSRRPRARSPKA